MDFFTIFSILIITVNLTLLALLYLSGNQGRKFLVTLIGAIIWGISMALIYSGFLEFRSPALLVIVPRVGFFGASLTVIGLIIFHISFIQKKFLPFNFIFPIILGATFLHVYTPYVVRGIKYSDTGIKFDYGNGYTIWGIVFILSLLYIFGLIIRATYTTKSKLLKKQLKYFIIGLSISFLVGVSTNLAYPMITGTSVLSGYGPLGLVFFSGFTTYAILKHQLFEIKTILSQVLFFMMGILLFSYVWVGRSTIEFLGTIVVTVVFAYLARGIDREIREELAQNKIVERSNHKIEVAIEAKDIFLRMTSHQLRTPLTSLNGFIEMILDGAQTTFGMNDPARRDLITVHLNVQRLGMVVNDILAVNALNANRFAVAMREHMDMREMLESLISEKRYFFDYYQTTVEYTTQGTGDFVAFIDPVRIRDAVSNVLNNAVFYGKGEVSVTVIDVEDAWVEIRIQDNGIGLERKEDQHIWQQDYRNPSSEYLNPNSTGMGLYVAKQTLKRHHGKILVESAGPGQGTTVIIRLLKVQS